MPILSTASDVPIMEIPLPEASTSDELLDRLRRIHKEGLPGFVVRASGLLDVDAHTHDEVAEVLSSTLRDNPDLEWQPSGHVDKGTLGATRRGEGELHHDAGTGLAPEFRIQRTKSGRGKVTLANAGSLGGNISEHMGDEASSLLRRNLVDPAVIAPEMYTTDLNEGDMVVFPPELSASSRHSKAGPVWHRFDTSSLMRQGEVLVVKLVE